MKGTTARTRSRIPLWLALGACAAASFWVANSVAPWDGDLRGAWHQYEYLAEGFLHGHTYLSVEPPPELLRLPDPYDPAANAPYRIWDASLYRGKYYLYHGPVPALVLMLPWRALTGHALPQRIAVATFAVFGLAGLALLLWEVRGRHFPRLSPSALGAILVVAFHASWLPVTLRRPAVWELPIVSTVAFMWWSLYFLWKFQESGGRTRWAVATAAALALAMGSRASSLLSAAAVALLLFAPVETPEYGRARKWGAACLAGALAAAGGIALLAYNHARFGSWTDFGMNYMLGREDDRGLRLFNPRFIPFNARTYLLSAPRLGPYFPFLHPFWSEDRPPGYVAFEEMYGVLWMMPVHLAALAAAAWALRERAARGMRAARVALAGAVLATGLSGLLLFCWAWACSRYMTEFLAGWTVATSIGLMAVFGLEDGRRPGRTVRILAAAAACWSVACVWLASAEFRGFMAEENPRTYAALAHALDYPSLWWARSHRVSFGPVDVAIRVPPSPGASQTVLLASGRPQSVNQLLIERLDGGRVRLVLAQNLHQVLATPPIDAPGGRLGIRLEAPWLYPPPAHPYWDGVPPALRQELQTLFSIGWGRGATRVHSDHSADPVDFAPAVRGGSDEASGLPWVEAVGPAATGR
jgi:hypothetical protein